VGGARSREGGVEAALPLRANEMVFVVSLIALGPTVASRAGPPEVGDRAPDFALADQRGVTMRLSDLLGKKRVVLAFYIKAFTPT